MVGSAQNFMKYLLVEWLHKFSDEPYLIYTELDELGFETRKIEIFPDGSWGYASQTEAFGSTLLASETIPSIDEIAEDQQFRPHQITQEVFEDIWLQRHNMISRKPEERGSIRLSSDVQTTLLMAGWFPGRQVADRVSQWNERLTRDSFEIFPAAKAALLEFGGLRAELHGPGEECARSSFNLDPLLGEHEADHFAHHARQLGEKLYPLGEHLNGQAHLAISESGKIYAIYGALWFVAETIEGALEKFVLGWKFI